MTFNRVTLIGHVSSAPCFRERVSVLGGAMVGLVTMALCPEAIAIKADGMKAAVTNLEHYLTGNVMRVMVTAGSLYGAYHAFANQKPGLLGGAVGIGLGVNFLMSWVKGTWAMLI